MSTTKGYKNIVQIMTRIQNPDTNHKNFEEFMLLLIDKTEKEIELNLEMLIRV